jgi:hypothetical protein
VNTTTCPKSDLAKTVVVLRHHLAYAHGRSKGHLDGGQDRWNFYSSRIRTVAATQTSVSMALRLYTCGLQCFDTGGQSDKTRSVSNLLVMTFELGIKERTSTIGFQYTAPRIWSTAWQTLTERVFQFIDDHS